MSERPTVSVIIPTYNRAAFLRATLQSLAGQVWSGKPFEVIVVDDGSSDGTAAVSDETFPFPLRYIYQANQGDAAARNTGARQSEADFLVFLDDDVVVLPDYLRHLVAAHGQATDRIIVGTEHLWLEPSNPLKEGPPLAAAKHQPESVGVPFAEVCSNNMSLPREAYFAVGTMRDLGFAGSSIWCDVDFAYRAYQQGFVFLRSTQALCWHRDHVYRSLDSHIRRMREVAYRAVVLFQRYPELAAHVPMFEDKLPVAWGRDRPALIARKLARPVTSSRMFLWGLERLVRVIGQSDSLIGARRVLLRWLIGGHVYQGYQAGWHAFVAERSPDNIPVRRQSQ
jgi:glycosyltransferase involved in cell wall biosynthesis